MHLINKSSMYKLIVLAIFISFTACKNKINKPLQKQIQSNSKDTTLKIFSTGVPDLESEIQLNDGNL